MEACRISKVTDKATGREIIILPTRRESMGDFSLGEAAAFSANHHVTGIAVAMTAADGTIWTIANWDQSLPPAPLCGAVSLLSARILQESGGIK